MKKIMITQCFIMIFAIAFAQTGNTWTQKADFGGGPRVGAFAFSIDSKGYVGAGISNSIYYKDFWEYDPASDTWTQKADYGGGFRSAAKGFSIGSKGYVGTGYYVKEYGFYKDFWEYDPGSNIWIRKADFGGNARSLATGFSIGNKGYIGAGEYGIHSYTYYKDFWEYDPAADNWTQKTDFGGVGRIDAVGFSIGSKGYMGTGSANNDKDKFKDFWEYDPSSNTWARKADFGGTAREGSVGLSIGSKGYLGTGYDITNAHKKDFWEYNPATNTWMQKSDFPGAAYSNPVGFSIGGKGYLGCGSYINTTYKDFWEYTPDNAITGPPKVISFTPASGPVGTSVTITGTNFGASPADNIVYFGATKATVTAAITTALTATVPIGATYQPITVTTNNLTAYSATPFVVTFSGSDSTFTNSSFAPEKYFATGISPVNIAFGDFDIDGKVDIVTANYDYNTISVLRNNSTKETLSFGKHVDYGDSITLPGLDLRGIATGDFDGDGYMDIAVTKANGYNSGKDSIFIYRNTGFDGIISFNEAVSYAVPSTPCSIAINDIDGDGKPDLAIVGQGEPTDSLTILRNTSTLGNISFAPKIDYLSGNRSRKVAISDLDGDEKPDIVIASLGGFSGELSILKNISTTGNILFAEKIDYTTSDYSTSVSIGDLDGDGKPDLAVTSDFIENILSIFRNASTVGNISFAEKVDYKLEATLNPASCSIGDLDGDNKPDLVIASYNKISILKNDCSVGKVLFNQQVDFNIDKIGDIKNVAIGDLDGDKIPDIAIGGYSASQIAILKNSINVPLITAVTDINSSQAYVHWRPYADAASYVVRRYQAGTTDYGNYLPVTDTFRKINNMSANSLYIAQVKAHLNNGDSSDWSAPYSFTTANTCAVPLNLRVSKITDTSAMLGWLLPVLTATDFKIRYKQSSQTEWSLKTKKGTETKYILWELKPSTLYNWQIRSMCTDDVTEWVKGPDFTTAASFAAVSSDANSSSVNITGKTVLQITPNPCKGNFTIYMQLPAKATATTIVLYNSLGVKVWQQQAGQLSGAVTKSIALENKLATGIYVLYIERSDIKLVQKIVVSK